MPATSRSRWFFARRNADRLRRLAFEVDDVDVAVGHQHLSEMQIAVNARQHRAATGLRQLAHRRGECFRAPPCTMARSWAALGVPFLPSVERGEGRDELLLRLLGPLRLSTRARRLRRERRIIGIARKDRMHLAKATPEQRGDRAVVLVLLGVGRLRLLGSRGEIRQAAHQQIQRPCPGVTLVANETLRDRQSVPLAVRIDAHDLSQQRCDVG